MNREQIEELARAPWAFASADLSEALRASLAMPTRAALPNRRPCITIDTQWQGVPITVTVGMYLDGRPGDVFADASYRAQPVVHGTLSDACVGLSIALQHGIQAANLAKSLGTVPFWQIGDNGQMEMVEAPASPIGAIIAIIAAVDWHPADDAGDYIGEAGE